MSDIALVDSANSSTTPLGAGGVFTGSVWTDLTDYSSISIMVFSNVASATNGLKIQWSTDGINIDDSQSHSYAGSASEEGRFIYSSVRTKFFRISYTNGGTAQGSFRLQTLLRRGPVFTSVNQFGITPTNDFDAGSGHSLLYGRNITSPSGTPVSLKTDDDVLSLIVAHPPNRSTQSERTVAASLSSVQLDFFGLFGASRRNFHIFNDTVRGSLYLRFGSAASLSSFNVKLPSQHFWELPQSWGVWSGTVHGIWDVADGNARLTEFF
jgi:hypothetical protein